MSELIHGEQILSSWLLVIHDSTNWKQINRRHINKQIASRGDTVNDYEIIGTEQNTIFQRSTTYRRTHYLCAVEHETRWRHSPFKILIDARSLLNIFTTIYAQLAAGAWIELFVPEIWINTIIFTIMSGRLNRRLGGALRERSSWNSLLCGGEGLALCMTFSC